jgi:hypothetical protein
MDVIVGLLQGASPTGQPADVDGGYSDTVEACAAGISEAVPRAMPRMAARVRNMVFIVVLQVSRGPQKHGRLVWHFVCR